MKIIFGDIVAPCVASSLFLSFFLYIRYANREVSRQYRYFALFLICFALFLIGRPIQLIAGLHPIPLWIANIRFYLFCAVCAPALFLSFETEDEILKHRLPAFALGQILGIVYIVFHTSAVTSNFTMLTIEGLTLSDVATKNMVPPFFGREVSIVAQSLAPLLFFTLPALFRLRSANDSRRRAFLYGTLIYGTAMIVGSLTRNWWIIYLCSLPSAILWGYGIVLEIRDTRMRGEQMGYILRRDVLGDIGIQMPTSESFEELLK